MVDTINRWTHRIVHSDGPCFTRGNGERSTPFYYARVNDLHWPQGGMVSAASNLCWLDMILMESSYERRYVDTLDCGTSIRGPLIFAPPGTRVCHSWDQPHLRTLTCLFDPKQLMSLSWFDWDWSACSLSRASSAANARLQRQMLLLAEELLSPGFASDIQIESLFTLMACELWSLTGMAEHTDSPKRLSARAMKTVCEFVDEGGPHLSVQDVAMNLDIGPRQFSAAFKATTGQTFRSYVRDRRILKARTLLKDTDLLIKQVAYRCGFAGTAAFTAAFHKAVGVSPIAFRNEGS